MLDIDVSIVTYAPRPGEMRALLASLVQPSPPGLRLHLFIEDNSAGPAAVGDIAALPELPAFASVRIERSGHNVGFGRGHNANAARGRSPWLFVLNPDCVLEPGALEGLAQAALASGDDVVAWEMRQVPYEHPKAYDPVTLETPWVSGAAVLLRRAAFEAVGGFDPRIFLYGEDVDLSWRLRAAGGRLTYQPRCAVVHRTYSRPHEEKPLQLFEGVLVNLCLRARYGGRREVLRGLRLLAREVTAWRAPLRRRAGLALAGLRFLAKWPHFARTRVASPTLQPCFAGWDYARHRDGAFHPFDSMRESPRAHPPLVSILIRTSGRPAWLRQALASCAQQTWPRLEVVVVEGGSGVCRPVVDEFAGRLDIRFEATGHPSGRAHNGNRALALARGEWLNFLDDDDLLFADHVEVALCAAQRAGVAGAYGLAWETHTRVSDRTQARFEELRHETPHAQRFDRMILWHHNYLPIQAVLFHRRLYERHGGFDEAMEQLEDWNLWTRYTLEDDFVLVEKTTSKYRVPADACEAADRQARLDDAYAAALERQGTMRGAFSPREVLAMAEQHARRHRVLARVAAGAPLADRLLRRLDLIK